MLTLSLRITGYGHTPSWMKIFGHLGSTGYGHNPSWMKIFGHLGSTFYACTQVQRWHGCIDRQHAYKCEAIHQQYTGVLTLSLRTTGFGHTPYWMKMFGHLGSTLDVCTHVQRRHGYIGRQHAYKCKAIHQQYKVCLHYLHVSLMLVTPLPG